jgi:alkanesulfonate monooxygenase SsuD/methylene tetrahydromethanopterin reductase-like flavin-dependent oxidoreductase (luciferase family)
VCARGLALISSLAGGRVILGLGVSHQHVNGALKVDLANADNDVRRCIVEVQACLRGEGPATHLAQPPARYNASVDLASRDLTLGFQTFVGEDLDALRQTARHKLTIYTQFSLFQHLFRVSDFLAETDEMEQGPRAESLINDLLESICQIGPVDRCKQRIAEYRDEELALPILTAPLSFAGAREVISALGASVTA